MKKAQKKIALDVMGADKGVAEMVRGAYDYRSEGGPVLPVLVGDEAQIIQVIKDNGLKFDHEIVHAPLTVTMEDNAVKAIRQKTDSSIVRGFELMKAGEVEAFVSPGNTGAVMAAGLLMLGRIPGILRPAIASIIPAPTGPVVLIDAGANADAKAFYLLQFAYMGEVYARKVIGIKEPRVGLLNIGAERTKGNELCLEAYPLLDASPHINFIGNIEGRDVASGVVDVVVTDGFTGNVVLKTLEGLSSVIFREIGGLIQSSYKNLLGGMFLKDSLQKFKAELNYEEYGGAPLLGLEGATVICHGSSGARAMKNALFFAHRMVEKDVNRTIREELEN